MSNVVSIVSEKPCATALLFYFNEDRYIKALRIEERLAKLGVNVTRVVNSSSFSDNLDFSNVDMVIYMEGCFSGPERGRLITKTAAAGKPLFPLNNKGSHFTWEKLASHVRLLRMLQKDQEEVTSKEIVTVAKAPSEQQQMFSQAPTINRTARSLADTVADTEQLASMYAAENERLKEEIAKCNVRIAESEKRCVELEGMTSQRSEWKVERGRMIEEHAKLLAELRTAKRDLHEQVTELTNRLAAAERERREWEEKAKEREREGGGGEVEIARLKTTIRELQGRLGGYVKHANANAGVVTKAKELEEKAHAFAELEQAHATLKDQVKGIDIIKLTALIPAWKADAVTADEVLKKSLKLDANGGSHGG